MTNAARTMPIGIGASIAPGPLPHHLVVGSISRSECRSVGYRSRYMKLSRLTALLTVMPLVSPADELTRILVDRTVPKEQGPKVAKF